MILSFTGTQEGMTFKQMDQVRRLLEELTPTMVIHGDCIGADSEFHSIVDTWRKKNGIYIPIKIYPSDNEKKRANCDSDIIMPQKPPLERNRDIALEGDRLLACPKEMIPIIRSGTWTTIRNAKKFGKIVYIVYPNGKVA